MKKQIKRSKKRNLIEWIIIIAVIAILYFTGLYTSVIGYMQSAFLYTGIISPNKEIPISEQHDANYFVRFTSLEGKSLTLLELKGKVIFMNFWASWCPPCRAEMPYIQDLYDDLKNKKIVFLMINLDNDPAKASKFIKDENYHFPVYRLTGNLPIEYQSNTIPTTIVISASGKIIFKEQGMAKYNTDKFKKLLLENR